MANSRLEKIGTIYTRTKGLLECGAVSWADRPLWYDVYEAFPPNEEPRFDRPASKLPLKEIFYDEDNIRAMLHKKIKNVGAVNLANVASKSFTQKFISTYNQLEKQYECDNVVATDKIFNEALEMLRKERQEAQPEGPVGSLTAAFKEVVSSKESAPNININVKDIFKD